ncbi:BatA domain-containing protein [Aurantibacter crassamenti]|uniref:BatA domain-containing protein n=1 Tax=Aurantibacter crassamenti TaxID=1837375 RepID=UPI001939B4E8|nr:BatA domain-containing protein [Aurantibacter crassamenti]MBM1107369.1 BatA domain-containing protein [Aurantibacter crassamenti]
MQFRHPELLWALLQLLIPIFIHLFQLRRFKKTPFTNVALLQKVVSNSRRSSTIKKWLLLFTRMLLLAALVIAFAQPFFAEKNALKKKETTIYIDDSFSMQAKSGTTTLLQNAIQELIQAIPETERFNLFTNTKEYRNSTIKDIQNELLSLDYTSEQLSLNEIKLKGESLFSQENDSRKEFILISDFQKRLGPIQNDSLEKTEHYFVQIRPEESKNIAIDSVFIHQENTENLELNVLISGTSINMSTPVSLFNDEKLIAKTAVVIDENNKGVVQFTIPSNEIINGRIEVSDNGLHYDNQLYFNINKKEKIKVLVIGDTDSEFLKRIYTEDEFQLTSTELKSLNYSAIESKDLIILNELEQINSALQANLKSFKSNGGSLVFIPGNQIDNNSYNETFSGLTNIKFLEQITSERKITGIDFTNPLYQNVFEKQVTNFQYPIVKKFVGIKTTLPSLLSFQDKNPFFIGTKGLYLFTASLSSENSNFKNSPLIVPTLYNVGLKSLESPQLYAVIGSTTQVDIAAQLSKDDILKMKKAEFEFIPQQQSFSKKVSLQFIENPQEDGIYTISDKQKVYQNLSFNYARNESDLTYSDLSTLNEASRSNSINSLFDTLQKDSSITELWKWFVIFALIFLTFEIFIQKFFR